MGHQKRIARVHIFSLAALAISLPAFAQSAEEPIAPAATEEAATAAPTNQITLDEVVVTAQKRSENLQDVPLSVSAIGAEAIEERQIASFEDLANQIAGFKFGDVAGVGQASIRGVGFSLVTGTGEGSVAIHSDGLFLSRPGALTMLQQDIAGVEVLRGPQGTLYGRNATAGVVNFISPAPTEEFTFGAKALYGSFERQKYSGFVSGSVWDGKIRARVSAIMDEQDDHFINIEFPGRDLGGREQIGGRFSLDFDPIDRLRFELRAFHSEEDFRGPLYAAYKPEASSVLTPAGSYADDPYEVRVNDVGLSQKSLTGGSLKAVFDITDLLSVTSISGYVDYGFKSDNYDGDGTSHNLFSVDRRENSETITQELMLSYDSDRFDWLVGGYYLREEAFNDFDAYADAVSLGVGVVDGLLGNVLADLGISTGEVQVVNIENISDEQSESSAIFGDFTYEMLPGWRIFAGARYLLDRKDHDFTNRYTVETGLLPDQSVNNCEHEKIRIESETGKGRVGTQVDLGDDAMVYGQFSTGYKSGGFAKGSCSNTFQPEELTAFEIGAKSTWFDGRVRLNGAIFHYDYDNLQVEEVNVPVVVVNNAQAKIDGAEFELNTIILEGLEAAVNGTFLYARYTEFRNADNAEAIVGAAEQDLSGNPLNRSPRFAGSASLQYERELWHLGRLMLRGEGIYNTTYTLREFDLPTDRQEAHWIVNLYATLYSADERWALNGYVKNLTDEAVLGGFLGVAGYKGATFGLPRNAGVELSFRF